LFPPQSPLVTHATHAPVLVLQAPSPSAFAAHSLLMEQAEQAPVTQMGVVPLQLVLSRQWTHRLVEVAQRGVAPVHALVLVPVHFTQLPLLLQAGAAAALRCAHSVSPLVGGLPWVQPRQVNDVVSQIGVATAAH
jgi:hypothetical protein